MEVLPSRLPGCVEVRPAVHHDARGSFAKPFHSSTFQALGLGREWKELFYSVSARGVVRGLHVQVPPAAQAKLVCCVAGEVFDVVVDVRVGSPTYGEFTTFGLAGATMNAVFVPHGMAHGFAALTDDAVVAYATSTEHDPVYDTGVRWDTVAGIPWPSASPIVSGRDAALPAFELFTSPFSYEAAGA